MSRSTISRCLLAAALVATGVALHPAPAAADLADIIPNLLGTQVVLDNTGHQAHFLDESARLRATGATINESLVESLSAFPTASSAGGFTYTFDPALGTFSRSTESFGPVFTERAQTIGDGKWNFGINYLQSSYDKLDDLDLGTGQIEFQLRHLDTPPSNDPAGPPQPFFEGDVISANTFLDVKTRTTVFFANYGVTDRFDVSVAVPLVKVDLDARTKLTIVRLSTSTIPGIHRFPGGGDTAEFAANDSATGVGDVLLRGKLRFLDSTRGGFATALDVRLPTGNENDLLGTGFTQVKLTLIGSGNFGRAGLHGNLGYNKASGSSDVIRDLPDEISYALGLDIAVHPRATLVAEVVGRTLRNATRASLSQDTFVFQAGPGGVTTNTQLPVVSFERSDLQLLLGSVGIKFNPAGNLLLTANALFSLSDDGLQDDGVIGVAGLEYSF